MTKKILLTIEGRQRETEETPEILHCRGSFHAYKDKYYIHYEEMADNDTGITKSRIIFSPVGLEMSRKGTVSSQLSFDINQMTEAEYTMTYGKLNFKIRTTNFVLEEEEELIEIRLEYGLFSMEQHLSDHSLIIRIEPNH